MLNVILVGHPNAGKTTLYNKLTGGHFKTGNYPGVTVDYSYGTISKQYSNQDIHIVDTPGINSLFPSSKDEEVTVHSIENHPKFGKADLILCVVDATQLSRQLYIPKLLIEAGFRVKIALTMVDLLTKKEKEVNTQTLETLLGCSADLINYKDNESISKLVNNVQSVQPTEIKNGKILEKSSEAIIQDYKEISTIAEKVIQSHGTKEAKDRSSKLDRFVLSPLLGYAIFFLVMGSLFTSIFWLAAPAMDAIEIGVGFVQGLAEQALPDSLFQDFVVNGIIGGVGAIIVFLPQIVILFFLMGILEDSGYLARAAVLIDAPLVKIGLSGRSFVPMLSGFACAIPALMSARTIKNPKERFITLFIIPLMACSARLPVFTILLSLITPADKPWIGGLGLLAIYTATIFFSSIVAYIIYRFQRVKGEFQFALELPKYRLPYIRSIGKNVIEKSKTYLVDAGTVILLISAIMWTLATFPQKSAEQPDQQSYLEQSGRLIEPALTPMGLEWRSGVAIISSFAAREVFVSSLIQVFRVSDSDDFEDETIRTALLQSLREATIPGTEQRIFTFSTIIGLIIFYIFALMCFPTVSVAKNEFGSWKMAMIQLFSLTTAGYVLAIVAVQTIRFLGVA